MNHLDQMLVESYDSRTVKHVFALNSVCFIKKFKNDVLRKKNNKNECSGKKNESLNEQIKKEINK